MKKTALITGITGQDGALLAEWLLDKGYTVHGMRRRASLFNTQRVDHLYRDPHEEEVPLFLHYGDLTDSLALTRLIQKVQPDELYNLAAQSHVAVSFESPEYTANADGLGTLRILEAIRTLGLQSKTRFYQASTSELFGKVEQAPQNERTPFYPRSPYGVAKLYAFWITVNYREAHGLYAANGILFNHESAVRGETFVTRKITRGLARIVLGMQRTVYLGNLDARRDWGHARDYVAAMWLILQQPVPDDYVVATGEPHSVREFCETAAHNLGISLEWKGSGVDERGVASRVDASSLMSAYGTRPMVRPGDVLFQVDSSYFRPAEVDSLVGDARKAREKLGWEPRETFESLVKEMVEGDLREAGRDLLCKNHGFRFRLDQPM